MLLSGREGNSRTLSPKILPVGANKERNARNTSEQRPRIHSRNKNSESKGGGIPPEDKETGAIPGSNTRGRKP